MLLVTTEQIPGRSYRVLGLVQGSTIQCKNIGHDFLSGLQNLVGGEMESYTQMMNEARDIASGRMVREAEALGADAVVGMRLYDVFCCAGGGGGHGLRDCGTL